MIPYSAEVFFAVMADYNRSIWPVQIVALVLGVMALGFLIMRARSASRILTGVLVAAWGWTALAWHYHTLADINFWAYGFAAVFALQGVVLLWAGRPRERFRFRGDAADWLGCVLCFMGLAGYPLICLMSGHDLSEAGFFGTAPEPTVLFTLGALLFARPVPLVASLIPLAWCAIATGIALELWITRDFGMAGAGVLTIVGLAVSWRRVRPD